MPVNDSDIEDNYFTKYPIYTKFRNTLLLYYIQIVVLILDLATKGTEARSIRVTLFREPT